MVLDMFVPSTVSITQDGDDVPGGSKPLPQLESRYEYWMKEILQHILVKHGQSMAPP